MIPHMTVTPDLTKLTGRRLSRRNQRFDDFARLFFTLLEVVLVFSFACSLAARAESLLGALPFSNIRRLATHPTRFTCNTRAIANESAGTFCVTVVPAATTDPSDCDRRNQLRIAPKKHIFADHRTMFSRSVVITGDGTGADVDAFRNRGITQITEVIGLGSFPQFSFFHLDKIPDFCFPPDHHTWAKMHERSQMCLVLDL